MHNPEWSKGSTEPWADKTVLTSVDHSVQVLGYIYALSKNLQVLYEDLQVFHENLQIEYIVHEGIMRHVGIMRLWSERYPVSGTYMYIKSTLNFDS